MVQYNVFTELCGDSADWVRCCMLMKWTLGYLMVLCGFISDRCGVWWVMTLWVGWKCWA